MHEVDKLFRCVGCGAPYTSIEGHMRNLLTFSWIAYGRCSGCGRDTFSHPVAQNEIDAANVRHLKAEVAELFGGKAKVESEG